ncbi:rhodanese-like domain-containing protein [Bacillus tuaregi]|uniref:rhodanese-like domain-containing protein n=1 Tax=Bacillus tuaregi TaxID=1816695 RepID=UPI0008F90DC9|nr:rhodanese-like domain-containing protein [Bacillus tuaregi]
MKSRLKWTSLLSVIALSTMLTVACSQDGTKPADSATVNETTEIKAMSGEDLVAQNSPEEKDKVLIVDVRSPEEYKAGHIPNAINIFVDEIESRLDEIADHKDMPVILYCNSGNKSGKAAEILVDNGFQDVTNAEGVKDFEYDLVQYEDVRGADFQALIDDNQDIVLVDVRPEKQVKEEGMLEGAINVPFDSVEDHLKELPKDKTIALYCNTGTKSSDVAKQLEELGYNQVVNSIEGVKEHSFTLVK